MKLINLLPPFQLKQNRIELLRLQVRKFWFLVLISLTVLFVLALSSRIVINNDTKETEARIEQLSSQLTSSNTRALEKQVVQLNNEIRNFETIKDQQYYWSKALIELGNIMPPELVVNLLTLDRESGEVIILGLAHERDSVLEFWANIKQSEYFKDINFPLANLESAQEVNFSFRFYINEEIIKQE